MNFNPDGSSAQLVGCLIEQVQRRFVSVFQRKTLVSHSVDSVDCKVIIHWNPPLTQTNARWAVAEHTKWSEMSNVLLDVQQV